MGVFPVTDVDARAVDLCGLDREERLDMATGAVDGLALNEIALAAAPAVG